MGEIKNQKLLRVGGVELRNSCEDTWKRLNFTEQPRYIIYAIKMVILFQ